MQLTSGGAGRGGVGLGLEISFGETGVDIAWANAVDADAFLAVIDGDGLGQPDDGGLGGTVAGAHWLDKKAVDRRHVHDSTLSCPQVGHKVFRAQEHTAEIYGDFPVPLFN